MTRWCDGGVVCRAGICVPQLDPKQMERGLVATPGAVPLRARAGWDAGTATRLTERAAAQAMRTSAALVRLQKIRFFKGQLCTGDKFHGTYTRARLHLHARLCALLTFSQFSLFACARRTVSVGHSTIMAVAHFFGAKPPAEGEVKEAADVAPAAKGALPGEPDLE